MGWLLYKSGKLYKGEIRMNSRMYKKIISLYKEGITSQVVVKMIIDLSKHSTEAAEKIDDFYNKIFVSILKKEEKVLDICDSQPYTLTSLKADTLAKVNYKSLHER